MIQCSISNEFKKDIHKALSDLKGRRHKAINKAFEYVNSHNQFKSDAYVSGLNSFLEENGITLTKSELDNLYKIAQDSETFKEFTHAIPQQIKRLDEESLSQGMSDFLINYNKNNDTYFDMTRMIKDFIATVNEFNSNISKSKEDNKTTITVGKSESNDEAIRLDSGQKIYLSNDFYVDVLQDINMLVHEKVKFDAIDNPFNLVLDKINSKFKSTVSENCFISRKRDEIVSTNESLNTNLNNAKSELLGVLVRTLKLNFENSDGKDIDGWTMPQTLLKSYKEIMSRVEIVNFINNAPTNNFKTQDDINIASAIYILNNFDDLLENNFSKMITIEKIFKGKNELSYEEKYSFTNTSFVTAFWAGEDFSSKDVSKNISNLAKYIVSTIPFTVEGEDGTRKASGEYLNERHFNYISGMLKSVEMEMVSLDLLSGEEIITMSTHGTQALKRLLEFVIDGHSSVVGKSNLSIFRSFYDYLYNTTIDESGDELSSIRYVYGYELDTKHVTSNIMDVENLLLSNMIKVAAPTYIEYVDGKTEYKSMMMTFVGRSALLNNAKNWIQTEITNRVYNDIDPKEKTKIEKYNIGEMSAVDVFKDIFQLNDTQYSEVIRQYPTKEIADSTISSFVKDVEKIISKRFNRNFANRTGTYDEDGNENIENVDYDSIIEVLKRSDEDVRAKLVDSIIMNLMDKMRIGASKIGSNSSNYKLTYDYVNNALLKNPTTVFENMLKNKIPVYSISTMAFNDSYNISNYLANVRNTTVSNSNPKYTNLFTTFPNILTKRNDTSREDGYENTNPKYPSNSTGFQLDLKSNGNITESKDFTKEQNLEVSFVHHYLNSRNNDLFTTELVNQSDKSRHVTKTINMQAYVEVNGEVMRLKDCTFDNLVSLHYDTQHTYGEYVFDQLVKFYENVTNTKYNKSETVYTALNTSLLFERINDYLTKNPDMDALSKRFNDAGLGLIEEFHYSMYRIDGNLVPRINQSLYSKILTWSNETIFKNDVNKNISLFYDSAKNYKFMKDTAEKYGENFKHQIQKYVMLTNIVKDNYLQLTVKHPYTDIIKSGKFVTDFTEYNDKDVKVPELDIENTHEAFNLSAPFEYLQPLAKEIIEFINLSTDFESLKLTSKKQYQEYFKKRLAGSELEEHLKEISEKKKVIYNFSASKSDKFTFHSDFSKKRKALDEFLKVLSNVVEDKPYVPTLGALSLKYAYENSERLKAFNKRMVSMPASVENYQLNTLFGLHENCKVAVVSDLTLPVFSINGGKDKFDIMDGAALANGFYSLLEEKSLPGKSLKGSKKPIGVYNDGVNSQLYKYAEFAINNEKCRGSNKSEVALKRMMRKMTDEKWTDKRINLTKNYMGEDLFDIDEMNNDKPIYMQDGSNYYRITNLEYNEFGSYTVTKQEVDEYGKELDSEPKEEVMNINSLYSLWHAFGAEYSMELRDGKLEYSEQSMDIVVNFMNCVGFVKEGETVDFTDISDVELNQNLIEQPLKQAMIGFVANKSAIKRGAVNINPDTAFTDDEALRYHSIKLNNFGIQQDASHEADLSEVTSPSQLLAALATGGRSLSSVNNTYDELGNLVANSIANLAEVIKLSNDETKLEISKKIKEKFMNSETSGLSYAVSLMKDTFKEVFPLEDEAFYKMLLTTCIGSINDSIKHKYSGGGEVLVPSAKMMQIYEIDGVKYLQADIMKISVDAYQNLKKIKDVNPELIEALMAEVDKPDEFSTIRQNFGLLVVGFLGKDYSLEDLATAAPQILEALINDHDLTQEIHCSEVRLYDSVQHGDSTYNIDTLEDLRFFHALDTNVDLILSKPRDLKPDETTYKINGRTINLWSHPLIGSINANPDDLDESTFRGSNFGIECNKYINYLSLNDSNALHQFYLRNNVNEDVKFEELFKARATMLFLNLINQNKDFDYSLLTKEHYDMIFEWVLNSDPKLDISPIMESLSDVIFETVDRKTTLAECITPKRFRSTFNLGSQALSEIDIDDINPPQIRNFKIDEDSNVQVYTEKNTFSFYVDGYNYEEDEDDRVYKEDLLNESGNLYIVSGKNKLYKIPKDLVDGIKIYKSKNSYRIYFNNQLNGSDLFSAINNISERRAVTMNTSDNIEDQVLYNELLSLIPSFNSNNSIKEHYYNGNETQIDLQTLMSEDDNTSAKFGFNLSNKIIAARIPGTGMQSEMSMDNVGYIEDDVNDVYVTHFQPWLQGSDFDIDKVYMLMANLGRTGDFESHSPFISYDSEEAFAESYKISVPSKRYYKKVNGSDTTLENLIKLYNNSSKSDDIIQKIKDFNNLIAYVQKLENPELEVNGIDFNIDDIINDINVHENYDYSINASKNVSFYNILETNKNLTNIIPSYNPVDVGPTKKVISKYVKDNVIYDLNDGNISVSETQENAGIGKKDVGVFANGNKVFLNLSTYFNNYFDRDESGLPSGFPRLKLFNDIDSDKNKFYYFGLFPDLNARSDQFASHYNRIKGFDNSAKDADIHKPNINQDLVFSELINLATDNAKELQLNKINAKIEVAKIHVLLAMFGCTREELVAYTTSNIFTDYVKYLDSDGMHSFDDFQSSHDQYSEEDIESLKHAFKLSGNLSNFASILGINQGVSTDLSKILKIKNKFEQIFKNMEVTKKDQDGKDIKIENSLNALASHYNLPNEGLSQTTLDIHGIDYFAFFNDADYRRLVINIYDRYVQENPDKEFVNYYKVINELPHFFHMLKAMSIGSETLEMSSSKLNFAFGKARDIYFTNYNKINKPYTEGSIGIATDLYSERMILDFLNNEKYDGTDMKKFDPENTVSELLGIDDDGKYIKDEQLVNWCRVKLNSFFSNIIRTYSEDNNFFTANLELATARYITDENEDNLVIYQLRNNILSNDDPNYQIKMINGFNAIANDEINGQKIGDILFLYNLLINKNKTKQKAFSRLFENYAKQDGTLPNKFLKFEINYEAKHIDNDVLLASFLKSVKKKDIGALFKNGLFRLLTLDIAEFEELNNRLTKTKPEESSESEEDERSDKAKEIDRLTKNLETAKQNIISSKESIDNLAKSISEMEKEYDEKHLQLLRDYYALEFIQYEHNKLPKKKRDLNKADVLNKVDALQRKIESTKSGNDWSIMMTTVKGYFTSKVLYDKAIKKEKTITNKLAKLDKKLNIVRVPRVYDVKASDLTLKNELNQLFKNNNIPIRISYVDSDSNVSEKDGITYIHVNKNSKNKFAEFIHEFDHIAFNISKINGVFPIDNYSMLMNSLSEVKYSTGELWSSINGRILDAHYNNLEESGRIEEILCRLHTDLVNGEISIDNIPRDILKLLDSSIDILNGLLKSGDREYVNILDKLTLDVFQSNLNSYIERNKSVDQFLRTDILKTKYLRILENVLKDSSEINKTECR